MEDPLGGDVTGNTFVDGGAAGIDSVSYQGIAEPLAYEDFVAQENLPGDFGSICVRFVTDEDSLVQEYHIPYGSDFPTDQLPPVPTHQGQYGSWEDVDLTGMTFDATIHAEYSDINTVRQSQEKRGERSLVLVEGSFDTTDELMLHEVDDAPGTPGTLVEAWGLELPADTGHTLRYMPPETTDNTVLWVRTDAGWQQADTSVDGSYLTCTAPAGTTAFAAVQMPASKVPLLAAACGAAAALLQRKPRKTLPGPMLVIDPRIRQMPRTKKPLQHRSLCCSGFLFQQLSINALKIFRLSSFTRNENSGCHCTAQTNLLSGRHTASVSPSSETAIAASPGASVHTSL